MMGNVVALTDFRARPTPLQAALAEAGRHPKIRAEDLATLRAVAGYATDDGFVDFHVSTWGAMELITGLDRWTVINRLGRVKKAGLWRKAGSYLYLSRMFRIGPEPTPEQVAAAELLFSVRDHLFEVERTIGDTDQHAYEVGWLKARPGMLSRSIAAMPTEEFLGNVRGLLRYRHLLFAEITEDPARGPRLRYKALTDHVLRMRRVAPR